MFAGPVHNHDLEVVFTPPYSMCVTRSTRRGGYDKKKMGLSRNSGRERDDDGKKGGANNDGSADSSSVISGVDVRLGPDINLPDTVFGCSPK